ncbi:GT-D fold domain-containing glycosyltransferase [Acinetobacter variabilis]|uniref:GT-D fold domain-containing glycosyltransferase n=1 Tax=Acinetobacter variabilis TaxID=70346 RepID=UPI0030FA0EAF
MSLQNIYHTLTSNFLGLKHVERVNIYQNQVVYLDIKTDTFFIALDINVQLDIFLVCRNQQSRKFISQYFNYPFTDKTKIFALNQSLLECFSISNKDNLVQIIHQLIDQLLAYQHDHQYLLNNLNSQVFQLNQEMKLKRLHDVCSDMASVYHNRFLSIRETLIVIKEHELSVARFGDGEIRCMVTNKGCIFQKHDWKLMQELRDISAQNNNLMVCYPGLLIEDDFWNNFWSEFWPKCKFYLNQDRLGDAMITRPEAFYFYGQQIVDLWKAIWEGKNICFVTGESSRLNAEHLIFSNIRSAQHILTKNNDAYTFIDDIFQQCIVKKDVDMFLIALGPTGTALAARLHQYGLRGLDIGHLNNSYDTVFLNKARPEQIDFIRNS